jgi:hypothetical protein
MARLTEVDAKQWHMRESAHYNGGKVFFAYLHRCVEQPRLSRFDRYERKDRSVTSTWRTDGQDRASLADAVEALNTPPVFSADEMAFLASSPDDYEAERREGLDYQLADSVLNKGAIEFERGRFRLTSLGRASIQEA